MISYPDSVQYLYSLGNEIKTAKLGLERIRELMAALGNPERSFKSVHVAGTNGKGSTCAMIESALRASGRRTGLYTSPHLIAPTERIRIDGRDVDEREFAEAFQHVHDVAMRALDEHPTYFETVTAMAFHLFRERGVEWTVVEVGLGGRLDATNVVAPELCVITPVDFDHEAWLGSSLTAIAGEKAGILKPGVPAVVSNQWPEADARIREVAAAVGAPLVEPIAPTDVEVDANGCRFVLGDLRIECPLAGEHQVENAATAVRALLALGLDAAVIERGVGTAAWPGRLERVGRRPDVILDGAHNPAGVRALAAYIRRFFAGRRVWLVYGAMRDKSIEEIGDLLAPVAHQIILTAPDSPRALRPEALAPLFDHPRVRIAADLAAALDLTRDADPDDAIFITGSLFLVGEARKLLVQ